MLFNEPSSSDYQAHGFSAHVLLGTVEKNKRASSIYLRGKKKHNNVKQAKEI